MSLFETPEHTRILEKYISKVERFLAYRERCSYELQVYMESRLQCDAQEVACILEFVSEHKMIDDDRFCRHRIEYRVQNGYGPFYIRNELSALHLDSEKIRQGLDEISAEQFVSASLKRSFAKYKSLINDPRHNDPQNKMIQYLYRRGYPWSLSKEIWQRLESMDE